MRLVDSHCHLHLMDLTAFDNQIQQVLASAQENGVEEVLCVAVELADHPRLCEISKQHKQVYISVGVHPNHEMAQEPTVEQLCQLAQFPACIAIGETGLDYFRLKDESQKTVQQQRYIAHIQTALAMKKPLIIHTRQAAVDTIALLKSEGAKQIGGVMHCFTESWEVAQQALALGFYISFSGIVTFKNAIELQEVAKRVPIDRILIETDSPYLAPAPFRGSQNQPAYVYRVAEMIAELRNESVEGLLKSPPTIFIHVLGFDVKE